VFQYRELVHALSDPAHMMEIDSRPHQGSCDEQRFCGIHPVFIDNCPFTGPDKVPDKPLCIN
jgi:hypothetical protein